MWAVERHPDVMQGRHLPAGLGDGFELRPGEPLGRGLRRLGIEQCEAAIRRFAGEDVDLAVHEARKAMKRIRAMLRLVRPVIGDRVYRYENRTLRDAARLLAGIRDGAVSVGTVGKIADRFGGALPLDVFDDLSERLDRRAVHIRQRIIHESDAIERVVATLERTRVRFATWPVDDTERSPYGSPLPDRFATIGGGLTRTYARGGQEMKRAYASPDAHNFHMWRKRVKYLRHQMEILRPLYPEVVGATAFTLERLGDILGDEHDIAALLGLLAVTPRLCPDPTERSLFAALAQHRRSELQAAARVLGTRAYAEKPAAFATRIESYWDSVRFPTDVGIELTGSLDRGERPPLSLEAGARLPSVTVERRV